MDMGIHEPYHPIQWERMGKYQPYPVRPFILASFFRQLFYFQTYESLKYFNDKESWIRLSKLNEQAMYRAYWLIAGIYYSFLSFHNM